MRHADHFAVAKSGRVGEGGSIAVELVILAPLITVLLAVVVLVGRVEATRADLAGAAHAAARDLSLARDPAAAMGDARALIDATLHVGSSDCLRATLRSSITATEVRVTVSCEVGLSDVAVLPVPGSMTVSATATEVIDQHREQGLG